MDETANLKLPYIMPAQAQKHVTHNEALRTLDALVQLTVNGRGRTAAPAGPADGERHIVAAPATGEWAGHEGEIAAFQDGAWCFHAPLAGWRAFAADEERLLVFSGRAWAPVGALEEVPMLGVNAGADAVNRLAVSAEASLFNHEGADHRLKINKAASGDTASVLFQTGFSGRAEFGLPGDDDWRVKVSADGAAWHEAIRIDRASGRVHLPATPAAREHLAAPRTYHVRADGDDGNDGLSDTPAGAFATIQRAIDTVSTLDLGVHNATIRIGPGIWTEPLVLKSVTGAGRAILYGDPSAPANVTLAVNAPHNGAAIHADGVAGTWQARGLLITTTAGRGLIVENYSVVEIGEVAFGATRQEHIRAVNGGAVVAVADYAIVGGAPRHIVAAFAGLTDIRGLAPRAVTIAISGNPNFSTAFVEASYLSMVRVDATWTGTATGQRYRAMQNSVIFTNNRGEQHLPGTGEGLAETGGLYA